MQAAIASAAAIALRQWLSPTRQNWAMLAAFVVFGVSSTGKTLQKIWARMTGTAVGTEPARDNAIIVVLAGVGLYLQTVSYLTMTFCVTVTLGLIYGILGEAAAPLLTLRLEETAIGALCGGIAALIILPVRTKDAVDAAIVTYLEAQKW